MTSKVQLRLVLQSLCDHVKRTTKVILLNSFNLILKIVALNADRNLVGETLTGWTEEALQGLSQSVAENL